MTDLDYMAEALKEALAAYAKGECPVGALLVEVRFAREKLDLEGPLMQKECRSPFVQWVKDIGRTEILDSEDL